MPITVYSMFDLKVDLPCREQVNLYVDLKRQGDKRPGDIDVYYCQEPPEVNPYPSQYMLENLDTFDLVLVSTDRLTDIDPKIQPFEFGTALVGPDLFVRDFFGVSTVVGDKTQTEGHLLRHEIWRRQDEIEVPKSFFVSQQGGHHQPLHDPVYYPLNPWQWPTLGDSKAPLFDVKFHIAIENVRSKYWFTEKLIDCFLTRTVPIYWGCLNIADYFDTNGMLLADSADDIIRHANWISDDLYDILHDSIEENYRLALQYIDLGQRLADKIRQSCKLSF